MLRTLVKWIARVAWLVWLVVMLLVGLKIALDNTQDVQVTLLGWQAPEFSLGFILCLALLVGVILGWFASTGPYFMARQRARRLDRQLTQTQQELTRLRTAPMKS